MSVYIYIHDCIYLYIYIVAMISYLDAVGWNDTECGDGESSPAWPSARIIALKMAISDSMFV